MRDPHHPDPKGAALALVTGADGALGHALVSRLLAVGYRVRALVHRPPSAEFAARAVPFVVGDICDRAAVETATREVEVIFHLAAKTHVNDPSPALWDEYKRVNIGGTRCIVEAGRAFGARRVVLFSTISVYGPTRPGEIFDEASPLQPQTVYAKTKVEAEQVALSVNNASGEALSVVLRLAAVYGPRIKGNYARLVSSLRRGWFVPVGRGNNRRTLVNVEDVATAALLGAEHEEAGGRVYNVTDGEFHRFKDIIAAISIAQGRRPPHWHLPIGPVKSVVSLLERMYVRAGKQPAVSRDLIDKILEDVAVSGDKIQRDLGFHPQIDLLTGWKQTIQFMESGLPLHLPNAPASIEHTLRKGNRSPGFSTEHINKNQC